MRGYPSTFKDRTDQETRELLTACAIRLACSSVGEDFVWARLIEAPPRIVCNDSWELVSFLSEPAISTHKIRAVALDRLKSGNYPAWRPLVILRTLAYVFGICLEVTHA